MYICIYIYRVSHRVQCVPPVSVHVVLKGALCAYVMLKQILVFNVY